MSNKQLKKDLEQIYSILSSGNQDLIALSERTLNRLAAVMESIDEHEALLKKLEGRKGEIIIKITKDGDQYCALMGEDLQAGIAGFGDDPVSALIELTTEMLDNTMVCNAMIDTLETK